MREEFEKLPEIANNLSIVHFSITLNTYIPKVLGCEDDVAYVQGAWMAFQEQQKIIDAYKLILKTQIGFDIANDVFNNAKITQTGD